MCRRIVGELEALGFRLEPDAGGARLCPPGLAEAVRVARSQKRELAALRLDPAMSRFLTPGAAAENLDALDLLIYVSAELAIIREVAGNMAVAMSTGVAQLSYKPFSWTNVACPDPRHSL